jgi:ABC-2 type transport system permease protein
MTIITSTIPAPSGPHYRVGGLVRSELTKMRSVRSTKWTLLITVVLTIALSIILTSIQAGHWSHVSLANRLTFDPTNLSLTGLSLGELTIGILGVMVITSEFGTGTIRSSLAAVPNRGLFLWAKVAAFTMVVLTIGEVISFAAFFIGQALLAHPVPHATIGQPGVLRAIVGGGLYLTLIGLLAMGIGTIIRHTAGALAAFVAILLIIPALIPAFPSGVQNAVSKFEPVSIGNAIATVNTHVAAGATPTFSPWAGVALLCLYAAVALGIGAWRLASRDA